MAKGKNWSPFDTRGEVIKISSEDEKALKRKSKPLKIIVPGVDIQDDAIYSEDLENDCYDA